MAQIVTSDDYCDVIRKTVEVVESENSDASDVMMKYLR